MAIAREGGRQGIGMASVEDFRVPGTGVFILGCLESRVTVLSQQRRALNLVEALLSDWFVGEGGRVAIVGAGAAGITAAAALATAGSGLTIDLFDREYHPMHLQRSSERDLHPRIYDWPLPDSTNPRAGLPILDWHAGPAKEVSTQIAAGFKTAVSEADGRVRFRDGSTVTAIQSMDDGVSRVRVEGQRNTEAYDAVILAIGFGYERRAEGQGFSSYWAPAPVLGPLPPDPVLLVSGNGDGGLVDFAAAALQDMSHDAMIDLIAKHPSVGEVVGPLLEIEERAWACEDEAGSDIFAAYKELRLPRPLLGAIHGKLRRRTTVWLHTREPRLFRRTTAIINRFTAFLIIEADRRYNVDERQIHHAFGLECARSDDGFSVGSTLVEASKMVPRFGPDRKANFHPFQAFIDAFDKRERPPADNGFRPAMPELGSDTIERFRRPPTANIQTGDPSIAFASQASSRIAPDVSADARGWLAARAIPFELASLDRCIRSALPEPVSRLLLAGIPVDILVDGQTPLELALSLLDGGPNARERAEVVASIVREGPRGVAAAAHQALTDGSRPRLAALLRAGVGIDVRDELGASLTARAIRADGEMEESDWTGLLAREAQPPLAPMEAAWLMLRASAQNRILMLRTLLDKGVPIDARLDGTAPSEPVRGNELGVWWPGGTALHFAMSPAAEPYGRFRAEHDRYSMDVLRLLLERGASPAAIDSTGNTPLHLAARWGLKDAAVLLSEAGGSVPALHDGNGQTPLDCAIDHTGSEAVALALARSALPTAPTDRVRLLHRAAAKLNLPMLELLLEKGCDPNAPYDGSPSPLMTLAHEQIGWVPPTPSTPCLSFLLSRGGDPMVRDTSGRTALHWFASGQEADAVELLLSAGIDPDATNKEGRTALMGASSPEICRMLLGAGACPSKKDAFGYDAADYAWLGGRGEVAALLQGRESTPGTQVRLLLAIRGCDVGRAEAALDDGVSPLTRDPAGWSALHLAAGTASIGMVRLLLERGAEVHQRDAGGRNALDHCLTSSTAKPAQIASCAIELINQGSSLDAVAAPDGTRVPAVFRGRLWWRDTALADRLLEACGAALGRNGETALMIAADWGTTRQVVAQLAVGADPDASDYDGRTALHHAARGGMGDTQDASFADKADALMSAGASIDAAAADGSTALFVAMTSANWEAARWLLHKGADPRRRNAAGLTPQLIAIRSGEAQLADLLLDASRGLGVR